MKNLWRAIVLYMLPGCILGGCSAWSFLRLSDCGREPLELLLGISVIWTFTAAIAACLLVRCRRLSAAYYPAVIIMGTAFSAAAGACRFFGISGWQANLPATIISAAASAFFIQCFNSDYLSKKDRAYFIAGVLLMGGFLFYAGFFKKLGWIETILFNLIELLLLTWALASPLTLYGKKLKCWLLRAAMFAIAVGLFFFAPVFMYSAWGAAPDMLPDGAWQLTHVTSQGSRFVWITPNDRSGIFTPDGKLISWYTPDEDLLPAIPGMLGILNQENPRIKLISNYNSVLPELFAQRANVNIDYQFVPGSLNGKLEKSSSFKKRSDNSSCVPIDPDDKYDLLIISAWDENQYPGTVYRQWALMQSTLKENSIVAIRGNLLLNPAIFRVLNESFPYSGVLPDPCHLWVFSAEKLNLAIESIDKNFSSKFNSIPGAYSMICSNADIFQKSSPAPQAEDLKLGSNGWFGSWLWLLPAAGVLFLWRGIRLLGERRNIMYEFWNSMENGFAGFGTLLLAIGILIINCGIFNLTAAVLALMTILIAVHWSAGKTIASLIGLAVMILAANGDTFWHYLLLPVMAQAMLNTGFIRNSSNFSSRQRRKLFAAIFLGMFFASVIMAAVWICKIPLLVVWLLFLAARLPGIWQNNNVRVY